MSQALANTTALTPIDGYDEDGTESASRGAKYLKFDGATQHFWFLREDGSVFPRGPLYAPDCWEENIKRSCGPWRHTYNVGLVDPKTGARYIVSNSTVGIKPAFDDSLDDLPF
jgi:hypothetical protein